MHKRFNNFSTRLKHYVEFWENITESELEAENWVNILTCFVDIKPIYDKKTHSVEDFSFGHLVTEKFFTIHARFHPKIHSKMRMHYQDRVFIIRRVINVNERGRYLYIIAQEE